MVFKALSSLRVIYRPLLQAEQSPKRGVSKLFRAYGLYNNGMHNHRRQCYGFQSSFELTGYITTTIVSNVMGRKFGFQSSFELTGYIT